MLSHTVNLGQSTFCRSKAATQVEATAAATYLLDLRSSVPNELSDTAVLSNDHSFTRPANLMFCVEVVLDFSPSLQSIQVGSIQDIFSRAIASAELWTQIGFEVREIEVIPARSMAPSSFKLKMSLRNCLHATSTVEVPFSGSSIPVHRLTSIYVSFRFSCEADTVHITNNKSPGEAQVTQEDECQQTLPPLAREKSEYTVLNQYLSSTLLLPLLDAALRHVICSKTRVTRGIVCSGDGMTQSLSNLAPSLFTPGHTEQMSSRNKLIPPIAKFLAAFQFWKKLAPDDAQRENTGQTSTRNLRSDDQWCRKLHEDVIADHLWITGNRALAAKGSSQQLKALRYSKGPRELLPYSPRIMEEESYGFCNEDNQLNITPNDMLDVEPGAELEPFSTLVFNETDIQDRSLLEVQGPSQSHRAVQERESESSMHNTVTNKTALSYGHKRDITQMAQTSGMISAAGEASMLLLDSEYHHTPYDHFRNTTTGFPSLDSSLSFSENESHLEFYQEDEPSLLSFCENHPRREQSDEVFSSGNGRLLDKVYSGWGAARQTRTHADECAEDMQVCFPKDIEEDDTMIMHGAWHEDMNARSLGADDISRRSLLPGDDSQWSSTRRWICTDNEIAACEEPMYI